MGRVRIHYPQLGEAVLAQKTPVTLGNLAVGETVTLNVDGAPWEWIVVHRGKPSSIYSDTFNGGTILLMRDCYEKRQWHMSTSNDYERSTIHSYLNSTFLSLLDTDVQAAIKQVKIPYRPGADPEDGWPIDTVASGENGLSAKVWLLSGYELGWTNSGGNPDSYLPADGAPLAYRSRIARMNGAATSWWLRSPAAQRGGDGAFRSGSSGALETDSTISTHPAVRPAIVLPDSYELPVPTTLTDLQGNPLSILAEQISGGVRMATGSYVGTGVYPRTIQIGFKPRLLMIIGPLHGAGYQGAAIVCGGISAGFSNSGSSFVNGSGVAQIIDDGFRLSQTTGNVSGQTYSYIALG